MNQLTSKLCGAGASNAAGLIGSSPVQSLQFIFLFFASIWSLQICSSGRQAQHPWRHRLSNGKHSQQIGLHWD